MFESVVGFSVLTGYVNQVLPYGLPHFFSSASVTISIYLLLPEVPRTVDQHMARELPEIQGGQIGKEEPQVKDPCGLISGSIL